MFEGHANFARLGSTTCDTAFQFGCSAKQRAARCSNCSKLLQFFFRPSAPKQLHLRDSTSVFKPGDSRFARLFFFNGSIFFIADNSVFVIWFRSAGWLTTVWRLGCRYWAFAILPWDEEKTQIEMA
jgi:hypothetical protein